jgi:hypothetical protein
MKLSRLKLAILAFFSIAVLAVWFVYEIAVYDACLDRINYDQALWHTCD